MATHVHVIEEMAKHVHVHIQEMAKHVHVHIQEMDAHQSF